MNVRNAETNFTPAGWHSVIPRIVAQHAEQLVEFLKHVFNATGEYRTDRPAILTIGDSMVMISEAGIRDPTPAFLYVYVADADITYQRALDAGARSLEEPSDTPYGDRRGMVQQAIQNRGRDDRVAEDRAPFAVTLVGCQDDAAPFVTCADQLEEDRRAEFIQR